MTSKTEDIVYRLKKRAEIRRNIPRGEPDRISDLLEEAASDIELLRRHKTHLLKLLATIPSIITDKLL